MLFAAALLSSAHLCLLGTASAVAQEPMTELRGQPVRGGLAHPEQAGWRPDASVPCTAMTFRIAARARTASPTCSTTTTCPGYCGGVPAAAYIAPRPVPAWVGQTYYTYQPFMPNELLYQHHRTYYRYYDQGRGMTRTSVSWSRPPVYVLSHFRIAR